MTNKPPKPPESLSAEARRLWKSTVEHYAIDEQAAMVLKAGLEAMDRREQARQAIAKDGAVIKDRWGQLKPSPWCGIERDSAATLYKAFRLLGLDLAQTGEGKR
jgi:phage terminase small subunit